MNKLWKNWTVHNLVSHPASEIVYWVSIPFVGREKAESISGWVHDVTIPDHAREEQVEWLKKVAEQKEINKMVDEVESAAVKAAHKVIEQHSEAFEKLEENKNEK